MNEVDKIFEKHEANTSDSIKRNMLCTILTDFIMREHSDVFIMLEDMPRLLGKIIYVSGGEIMYDPVRYIFGIKVCGESFSFNLSALSHEVRENISQFRDGFISARDDPTLPRDMNFILRRYYMYYEIDYSNEEVDEIDIAIKVLEDWANAKKE